MVTVTYIEHDGTEHKVDAEVGKSLMQNAVDNMVPGIDADCGGACACATCHVFVDEAWLAKTGEVDDIEDTMLEMTDVERQDNSRLSCQIIASPELDGLVIHVAENEY